MTVSDTQKRNTAEKLMRHGSFVVSLDPKHIGSSFPERFRDKVHVDVRVSRTSCYLRDGGLTGLVVTLGGEQIAIDVPWRSVFGMTSDKEPTLGRIWPSDAPLALRQTLADMAPERERRDSGVQVSNVVDLSAFRARKAMRR